MQVKLLDLVSQYAAIRQEVREAMDEVCDAQALILGPHVEKFEKSLASYCGTRHAIGVSSGTDALLCALMAIDIRPGDEVICPSFTFFATAGSIARLGAIPVFVDIDPRTFNLNPELIEKKITPRTRAILPVHLFGQCADMTGICQIARRHELPVIEDAAQAIGARHRDQPACSMGLAGCLSFYPTKNLGAFGDAGAICCNDDALAEKIRKLRVHGSGHTYYHDYIGGMFRMAAIQAAVLSVKLKYLDGWHAARRRNAAIYDQMLEAGPEGTSSAATRIVRPYIAPENSSVYNQYVVRVPDRDAVKARLQERGIGSAVYYPLGLHLQKCFGYLGYREGDLPETERACREVLALPIYPELTPEQVRYVARTLQEVVC
ncbi:MAG: DegT/DnrJ/EryC1/StrS family aminotransferase [Phycisphaerae bacterium]|nr:DegT/DnrJ/EryC1/StrS family aminotransferase [Phycisphaerae bacterium]MDW8261749.1 DegT/DnrJ/EryC1/StrS family aminotransferase [Phycisphaerales bacterium]